MDGASSTNPDYTKNPKIMHYLIELQPLKPAMILLILSIGVFQDEKDNSKNRYVQVKDKR